VRQKLQGVLTVTTPEDRLLVAAAAAAAAAGSSGGGASSGSVASGAVSATGLDPAALAGGVEREIFGQTRLEDTAECGGGGSLVGTAYKRKLRQLAFNLYELTHTCPPYAQPF